MVELAEIPQTTRERIEQIGSADLVVGLLSPDAAGEFEPALARVRDAITQLGKSVRAVVLRTGEPSSQVETPAPIRVVTLPPVLPSGSVEEIGEGYQAVLAVSRNLNARATAVIVSDLSGVTPQWIYGLMQPVLDLDFDLVAPRYIHSRFEGLVNRALVSPLTRALYGRRIAHPLGPDFGFSGRLVERLTDDSAANARPRRVTSLAALAVEAVSGGFELCQSVVGVRKYPRTDWLNQSSVLAQILGPVFREVEQHAPYWQRIRGSQPVPLLGDLSDAQEDPSSPDVRRMLESFELGHRDLREIWGAVLPPGILLELGKLARLPPEQFRMTHGLWARIVYDFALGFRLRTINPDHLLRAMTPLYLAWVASYALDSATADTAAVEENLEQLALAFEVAKPYAVSRWRWPDRFHP